MKQQYYVNNNSQAKGGDYEVHVSTCRFFSLMNSRTYLGAFETCQEAVRAAKKIYQKADGCATCCSACHTR